MNYQSLFCIDSLSFLIEKVVIFFAEVVLKNKTV